MPRGVKYGKWDTHNIERALTAVRNGDMGLNAAAREHSVPKSRLKRHLDGHNWYAPEKNEVIGSVCNLTPQVEKELMEHVLKMEHVMFGMTPT